MSMTSIELSDELRKMADSIPYSLKALLEFGIKFKYAEHLDIMEGYAEYPGNYLTTKLEKVTNKLEEVCNDKNNI